MNYMDTIIGQQQREFIRKQDDVIKEAFIRNGVDVNDFEFLKKNVSRVIVEGDKFDHYYLYHGTPKEVRVISVQRTPEINTTHSDNKYSITTTCKYY